MDGEVTSLMLMPMLAKYSSVCVEMGAAPVRKNLHWSRPIACLACARHRYASGAFVQLVKVLKFKVLFYNSFRVGGVVG